MEKIISVYRMECADAGEYGEIYFDPTLAEKEFDELPKKLNLKNGDMVVEKVYEYTIFSEDLIDYSIEDILEKELYYKKILYMTADKN